MPRSGRGVKLHIRRVFILEDSGQLLPQYLRFIRGVIDSSDLPLNVSRELLQGSRVVDHIRSSATKRILKLLADLAEKEPAKYAAFWTEFGAVLKEGWRGFLEPRRDRQAAALYLHQIRRPAGGRIAQRLHRRMKEGQDKIYYLLAPSLAAAKSSPHLETFNSKGIEVLLLTEDIDNWLVAACATSKASGCSPSPRAPPTWAAGGRSRSPGQGTGERRVRRPGGQAEGHPGRPGLGRPVTSRLTTSPACLVANETTSTSTRPAG